MLAALLLPLRPKPPPAAAAVVPLPLATSRTTAPDAELVARARQGDGGARRELYLRHVRPVAGRVTRLLARAGDAEDAVQDAFLEAFRDLDRLREPSRFDAWLMRIAVHQAHRRLRRRRLLLRIGLAEDADDATLEALAAPDCDVELRLKLGRLDQALARLPSELRLVWMLHHAEGCELAEVAELCGCSLATIKRRLARARDRIAHQIDLLLLPEVKP